MTGKLDLVFVGLSLSSSWGSGHATTFRSLLRGLHELGHRVRFLECDKPWYAANRDLPDPDFCELSLYKDVEDLVATHGRTVMSADAVIVGSYVPDGIEVIDRMLALTPDRVSFYDIDTPITLARLARGEEEYLAARQIPKLNAYFSFTGGPTLQRLEREFGARRAVALHCSVEEEKYRETDSAKIWDLGYLGTYSPDRQPTLERLLIEPARRLPNKRFVVAGPQYPAGIDWPENVERIEHLPPSEHADFYTRQRFTLNVTRADMIAAGWSPSVRIFEAAAVGTPLISDDWRGLTELLPDGEAIRIAHTSDDVVAVLETLGKAERQDLATRARAIVLASHTGLARARELVTALSLVKATPPRTARTTRINGKDANMAAGTKRILVTGGAGFLGSHLCELLIGRGHHVVCLDNLQSGSIDNVRALRASNRFSFVEHDICDEMPNLPRIDEIYNLACAASPPRYQADPVHTMMTSVVGTNRLLELANRCGAKLLQASTSEIYGDPEEHPQREDYWGHVNPNGLRACYDEGKRAAETLCFDYMRQHHVDVRVARIFNTYGPRMRADDGRIVSNLICQALTGDALTIYGSGEQTRSFCYVSDLIRGLVLLMEVKANPGAAVNIGNPNEFTINELADIVLSMTGSPSRLVRRPLPQDDPRRRCPDIGRAVDVLGWKPEVPLSAGLQPTINWFASQVTVEPPAPRKRTKGVLEPALPQASSGTLHA